MRRILTALALAAGMIVVPGMTPAHADDCGPWMDRHLPAAQRADLLLPEMTLDEKTTVLHSVSDSTHSRETLPVPRLCIPALRMNNGPEGVGSGGVTQFQTTALPAPLDLAASFDPAMARSYGAVEGRETRATGRDLMEGPDINIARTPLNGRNFEAYGEDPYLAGAISAGNIDGIQSQGTIADPKHYAANNQEQDRTTIDERIDERTLREIYLPAFEQSAQHAGAVMCAYNKINGLFACQQPDVLQGILKNEWKYDGFVMSDFGACHDTVACATSGTDFELPDGAHYGEPLKQAVLDGQVSMATLDDHVHRVLTAMFKFGLFDREHTVTPIDEERDAGTAQAAAEAGTVLLKNSGGVLPLARDRSVALIGPSAADAVVTGGGSAGVAALRSVSPRDSISKRGVQVNYAQGMPPVDLGPQPAVPASVLTAEDGTPGLTARYYDNATWSGEPKLTRVDRQVVMDPTGGRPAPGLPQDNWSIRWNGTFTVPVDGDYTFHLTNHARAALYLDGAKVIDNGGGFPGVTKSATVHLAKGERHAIDVDWTKPGGQAMIELAWTPPAAAFDAQINEAVAAAKRSDVAVVFAANKDTEAIDRTGLALPGYQDRLIEAVAAANPRTVVVLNTGGPVTMPWAGKVAGIVEAWYPGEEDGDAAASVLYGDVDPGGRLPVTFPKSLADNPANTPEQYPGVNGVATYSEGLRVGYRHYDATGTEPLYAFGDGLSYTTFAYRHLTVTRQGDTVQASADVTNTGRRTGTAVPQLYVGMPGEPPSQLKGFTKVSLRPGQTRHLTFALPRRAFSSWDTSTHAWKVTGGTYTVKVGPSSRDLPLRASLQLP